MQQQNNHHLNKTHNLSFLISPSQRLVIHDASNDSTQILNIKAEECITNHNNNKLTIISSKTVKCYNIQHGLTSDSQTIFQSYFPKKVEGLAIDNKDTIVVSDKFGDIYQATSQNPVYLNSNLGIPTFFKYITNPQNKKEFIMLGDDYCKLKVYNYLNMHEVIAIWYIPNSVPLDVLKIDDKRFALLVKHEDKQNLRHTYKLYQFQIDNLQEGDFRGSLIYSDKSQQLNSSEYHPCTMAYSQHSRTLYFLKLYDNQIHVTSFSSQGQNDSDLFKETKQQTIVLPQKVIQANSIDTQIISNKDGGQRQSMLICYGKYYNDENQTNGQIKEENNGQVSWVKLQNNQQNGHYFKINDKQYLLKLTL